MKKIIHTSHILFILTASLLMGSCQLGKHYTRPELNLPEQLDDKNVDSASIADYPWEQLYGHYFTNAYPQKPIVQQRHAHRCCPNKRTGRYQTD